MSTRVPWNGTSRLRLPFGALPCIIEKSDFGNLLPEYDLLKVQKKN